tara:strand:+ start:146 stop:1804 length:1659 start_codon:yes stop_codon:yes gene_type:complete
MTDSRFPNDVSEFGVEIETDTVIKQTVKGRVQEYKTFYKDGNTTILPVDSNGIVLPEAEPIYTNGVWDQSKITEPNVNSRGRKTNVTIAGLQSETGVFPPSTAESTIYTGVINQQLKDSTKNHANAVGDPVPSYTTISEYSTEITREINRLEAELAQETNNKDRNALTKKIRSLQEKLDSENDLLLPDGATGVLARGAENYDSEEDIMFFQTVKYPMDMSDQQDRFSITCYSYQAPYATATEKSNIGSAYGVQRSSPYRKKLGAGLLLPMPNNMVDGNARKWEEDNINNQALDAVRASMSNGMSQIIAGKLGLNGFQAFLKNTMGTLRSATQQSGRQELFANEISQLVGDMGYDVSADTILSRTAGVIANANTELLFAGVSLRSFEFNWLMSPRDIREAAQVRMIIRALKQWSAPRKLKKLVSGKDGADARGTGQAGGPTYFLGTPNIFRLRYITAGNKDILGVNKFKPCALTDINLNYTPEGMWMAYHDGQPVAVQMSLKFNELEPIYNTDYSPNIMPGRAFDKSNDESIGDLMPISVIRQDSPYTADVGY